MDYENTVFCIPSYKRSDSQETLSFLRTAGVPKDKINIFVQTVEDLHNYEKYQTECGVIYAHADNLPQARNNILEAFSAEKNIVMMDDDISSISVGIKGKPFVEIDVLSLFSMAFEKTAEMRGSMFGFYPVYNNFFMSDTIDTQKPVNTILGFPKGFKYRFDKRFIAKEDLELCGRVIASGGRVVRFNNVAFKAKHRTNSGGTHDIWKSGVNKKYANLLEQLYPDIYKVMESKQEEVRAITKGGRKGGQSWTK